MPELDPYRVLEVGRNASSDEIQAAFDRIMRYLAPESLALYSILDESELAAQRTQTQEAYRVLSDPELRDAFDRKRGETTENYPPVIVPETPQDTTVTLGRMARAPTRTEPPRRGLRTLQTQLPLGLGERAAQTIAAPVPAPIAAPITTPAATLVAESMPPLVVEAGPASEGAALNVSLETPPVERPEPIIRRAGESAPRSPREPPPVERPVRQAPPQVAVTPRPARFAPPAPAVRPAVAATRVAAPAQSRGRRLDITLPLPELAPDSELTGAVFRRLRESAQASLADVSLITKVGVRYLRSIEDNDLTALPAPVYVRGFVREYARVLGFDIEAATRAYMKAYERHRSEK